MAKKNTFLLIGAAALAYFVFRPGGIIAKQTQKTPNIDEMDETPEVKQLDAVIDTEKEKISVPEAIDKARDIATPAQDVAVIIQTPSGTSNIAVTTGKKRRLFKGKAKSKIRISRKALANLRAEAVSRCKSIKTQKARLSCRRDYIKKGQGMIKSLTKGPINF